MNLTSYTITYIYVTDVDCGQRWNELISIITIVAGKLL